MVPHVVVHPLPVALVVHQGVLLPPAELEPPLLVVLVAPQDVRPLEVVAHLLVEAVAEELLLVEDKQVRSINFPFTSRSLTFSI